MSPFGWFVAGLAVSVLGAGLLAFCLWLSVARYRKLYPEGWPGPFATPGLASDDQALERRLQIIESRLSDVEDQLRKGVTA